MMSPINKDTRRAKNQNFENVSDTPHSDFEAEVEQHHLSLRGRRLTAALAFVAGAGFTLFGYIVSILRDIGP